MKKVVLKLEFYEDKVKQRAMQKVSGVSGVESIAIDMKEKKMTVCGDMDPVKVASQLRKVCHTDMISVGPAKEPEKKKDDPPPPALPPPPKKDVEPKKDSSHHKEIPEPKKKSVAGLEGPGGDDKKKLEIKVKELNHGPPPSAPAPAPASAAPPVAAATVPSAAPPAQNGQLVKAFANLPPPPYHHHPYPPPPPMPYPHYHHCPPPPPATAYYIRSVEDNPNSCVIC